MKRLILLPIRFVFTIVNLIWAFISGILALCTFPLIYVFTWNSQVSTNFSLLVFARLLSIVFSGLGFIYTMIALNGEEERSRYIINLALSIDQLGNTSASELLNDVFCKSGYSNEVRYGDPDQTISYVTGSLYLSNSLTRSGALFNYMLNKVDKRHTLKAVELEENRTVKL